MMRKSFYERYEGALLIPSHTDCMEALTRVEPPTVSWKPLPPMTDVYVDHPPPYNPVRKVPGKYAGEASVDRRPQRDKSASSSHEVVRGGPRTEGPRKRKHKHKRSPHNLSTFEIPWRRDDWEVGEFIPFPHAKMFHWWTW